MSSTELVPRLRRELAFIREYDMLPPGSIVLCAVSGGADSVYLLDLLLHLCQSPDFSFTLRAAHYNHQLRGEESDRDEAFVRTFCTQRKIPLLVGRGDVAGEAKRRKQGVEETARSMRYAFLYDSARQVGADRIATAHHADDNAETLLLHLLRGTGLQGLTGISPRTGPLIRPLLCTSRQEILSSLRGRLPYVEDSSNSDQRYTRNRIRFQIMPALSALDPDFPLHWARTFRYLRSDNDYLNAQAALLSAQARREERGVVIPTAAIAQAPDPLAARALRQLLSLTEGGSADCTGAHLEALLKLCREGSASSMLHLPHGLLARREYDLLVLTCQDQSPFIKPFVPHEGDNPVPGTAWSVVLDGKPWPGLTVRSRRAGDSLTLPGGHSRSLKKLLIDRKVPRVQRDSLPIAADDLGVIAVAGLGSNLSHPRHERVRIILRKEETERCRQTK